MAIRRRVKLSSVSARLAVLDIVCFFPTYYMPVDQDVRLIWFDYGMVFLALMIKKHLDQFTEPVALQTCTRRPDPGKPRGPRTPPPAPPP